MFRTILCRPHDTTRRPCTAWAACAPHQMRLIAIVWIAVAFAFVVAFAVDKDALRFETSSTDRG